MLFLLVLLLRVLVLLLLLLLTSQADRVCVLSVEVGQRAALLVYHRHSPRDKPASPPPPPPKAKQEQPVRPVTAK